MSHLARPYPDGPTQCWGCSEHFSVPGEMECFQRALSGDTEFNLMSHHAHFQMVRQTGEGKVEDLGSGRP